VILTILRQKLKKPATQCPHVCANSDGDGHFANLQHLTTELSGCNQLTAPWNWVVQWVVDIQGGPN